MDDLIATLIELGRIKEEDRELLCHRLEVEIKEELIALHWAAMSKFRKDVINSIRDFGIRIYGDEGWRDIKDSPGVEFYSFIEDRQELAKLYNATKINLNLPTSSYLNTSTFNMASSGCFMLSSYVDDLFKYFDEGKDMACFRDLDDLKGKIRYYLLHPEERERIASNARERVLTEHTFCQRARRLVEIAGGL